MQHVPQVAAATSWGPLSRCPCFVRWQASFAALRLQHAISQPFSGTTETMASAKGASNDSTANSAVNRKRRMPLSRQNDNITSLQKCGRGNYREQLRRKSETGGPRDCMVGARDRSGSVPRVDNVAGTASGGENRTTGLATSKCCGSTVLPCHWNCAHPSRVSVGPSTGALSIEQWCFPARLQHSGNSREGAENAGVISSKLNNNDIRMATTRRTKPSIARFVSWGWWATSWRGSEYRSPVSAVLPGRRVGNSPGLRSSDPPAQTLYRVRASHPLWSGAGLDRLPG